MEKTIVVVSTELKRERELSFPFSEKWIDQAEDAVSVIEETFSLSKKTVEHFVLLCLDSKNAVTAALISKGDAISSKVSIPEIFRIALLSGATEILVAHNHPSGSLTVSNTDVLATRAIRDAGELLGIKLVDSLIISDQGHVSLRKQKII